MRPCCNNSIAHCRRTRRVRGIATRAIAADRWGPGSPRVQRDGKIRDRTSARHRGHGGHPAPFHPRQYSAPHAYRALVELDKALRTTFLCRYLHRMELRREIHEGLNVVESWNGANDFILYGRGGGMATNRLEDQEATMLALHLLQSCMVYVNTLMLQRVLGEPIWLERMGTSERRAMTPLFWGHVNPYGTFQLDMNARLPLDPPMSAASAGQLPLQGV